MKIADIRKLKTAEMATQANELRTEIAELRRRVHIGETTNNRMIRNKRKDLARVLTVLGEQLAKESA
jgi:ribosomal protein L29